MSALVVIPTFVAELACEGRISPRGLVLYATLRRDATPTVGSHRGATWPSMRFLHDYETPALGTRSDREAWLSLSEVAREVNITYRQAASLLVELVEAGAVEKVTGLLGDTSVYLFNDALPVEV